MYASKEISHNKIKELYFNRIYTYVWIHEMEKKTIAQWSSIRNGTEMKCSHAFVFRYDKKKLWRMNWPGRLREQHTHTHTHTNGWNFWNDNSFNRKKNYIYISKIGSNLSLSLSHLQNQFQWCGICYQSLDRIHTRLLWDCDCRWKSRTTFDGICFELNKWLGTHTKKTTTTTRRTKTLTVL